MRLVFDSNVLISALLFGSSIPAKALLCVKSANANLLISKAVFAELFEVTMRPKFDKYVSKEIRQSFLIELLFISTKVEIFSCVRLCRDPKDDKYLDLALSGKADSIISGDPDLLVLNPFENIAIITPKEFLDRLAQRR
ncbi:MAG: putative toxin-antitoxin system toxin component, PIN family [Bacteroidota bacterium]